MMPVAQPAPLAAPTIIRQTFERPGPRAWVRVEAAATAATLLINGRMVGSHLGAWTAFEFEVTEFLRPVGLLNELELHCEDRIHTTNGFLPVLGVRWSGARRVQVLGAPTPLRPAVPQRSTVRGTQLLVDGRPVRIRGSLHWGYYPELGRPWPDETRMRREILELRSLGFNLIKFCLWVPPPRYYELCDELGMLVWQEYPVWDAPLRDPAILSEYREFFLQDRGFPCIILRTMTCENDHVSPAIGRALVELAHELIPGCLALDNSGWLCNEQHGDFHDEHPYLHNAQWRYYGARMRPRLRKPLLLGETMAVETWEPPVTGEPPTGEADGARGSDSSFLTPAETERLRAVSRQTALAVRRYQIETLARDLPEAGYVVTGLRDTDQARLGLYTRAGQCKYTADQWSWHGEALGPPREVPELSGPVIGPRKGQWKCPEYLWWSPLVRVLDDSLPRELIEREACFELLSGRVLERCEGTRVLVEVWDLRGSEPRRHPLVAEYCSLGRPGFVSAFRHDTPAGRALEAALRARLAQIEAGRLPRPPEIGQLVGTSIVLEEWEMWLDPGSSSITREPGPLDMKRIAGPWRRVRCDTLLVNRGANVFEGWAVFRTRFECPAGRWTLRCEAVADYYEVFLDGAQIGEAGPRHGTWDGTRDVPRNFELDLAAGEHEIVFRVRDWRAAGGMVGPVYLAQDLSERIF